MTRPTKKTSSAARTLHFYGHVTKTQWYEFLLAVISTLGFVLLLSYANPYIIGKIVDRVSTGDTNGNTVEVFAPYVIAFVLVNLFGQICSKLQDYFAAKVEIKASYELATTVFDTLANQSMTFYASRFGGSLVSQTQKFVSAYSILMDNFIYAVIPIVASAVLTIILLWPLVPLYVISLFCLLIVYIFVAFKLYKRILPLNDLTAAAQNKLSGVLSDSITNILAVKTAGREDYERSLFKTANRQVQYADSRRMKASILRGAATSSIIVIIMMFLAVFVAGGHALWGISAGTLVMMFTYTYSITMQFNRLNQTFQQINRSFGDAHDMTIILDEPRLVSDKPAAPDLHLTRGDIKFENLGFCYEEIDSKTCVFRNFSLEIPPGQRIGLVGKSGSGKTTLTTLLLRLADIQQGHILIDGQDISHVTQGSLRRQIAYVPQEPLLFHRSIKENIAYGRPNASDEEVIQAAQDANALEFIHKLPHGFKTLTGERGVKLSGGQRQRIAIARAMLADAPILVLDEATSALDSESEKLIQDALKKLMTGRTSLVIAHRLSTVASLDRIVVLSEGKIVEDGTHSELVRAQGEYACLWNRQSGSFLGGE